MASIDTYLEQLIARKGSDLHLTAERPPMMRVDGDMVALTNTPVEHAVVDGLIREIMDEKSLHDYTETCDADFAYEIEGLARFRVNVFQSRYGMGSVFRQIPSKVLTADDLKLPESVRELSKLSKGLVLVTGPTGSGKSTTLAALIDLINKTRSDHIITIEDPIEFVHQDHKCLINQRQVKHHTASFSSALRAALRQDPDIVLVGELRDLETIEIAMETAETGHLVFGTLHTTTAASTMDRIIDVFPENRQNQIRAMLANSLKAVVAQTLLKKIGGGRVAALEILKVDTGISSLVRDGKIHQIPSAMQVGGNKGMKLMNSALLELVQSGTVDPNEAYLKAVDKDSLEAMLSRAGFPISSGGTAPAAGRATTPGIPPRSGGAVTTPGIPPRPSAASSDDDGKKRKGFFR